MTALEPGPGMGFFTLELARLVGPGGRIVAVDAQPQMIAGLPRWAERAGLLDRIETRVAPATTMALHDCEGAFDFVLAFAVVHELPSAETFFAEAHEEFEKELAIAAQSGLSASPGPRIRRSRSAVLNKA